MPSLTQDNPLSYGWPDACNNGAPNQRAAMILCYEAEQDSAQVPIVPTYRHSDGTQSLFFDRHTRWRSKN